MLSYILDLKFEKMHWFKLFLHVAAAVSVVKTFQYLYKSRRKKMIDKKYVFASSWCNKHQVNVYVDVCCVNVVKLSLFTHCFEVLSAVGCDGQICGTVQKKVKRKLKFCKILQCTARFRLRSYPIWPLLLARAGLLFIKLGLKDKKESDTCSLCTTVFFQSSQPL